MLLGWICAGQVLAQESIPKNWNVERIRGTRHVPYPPASGRPYLFDKFAPGVIELSSGVEIGDYQLRYSTYRDELIYYDKEIPAQIVIDKQSLKGFRIMDPMGELHRYRKQYFNGFSPGDRFFEVLEDGPIALLIYRKVNLELCTPYNDITGKLNNVTYQESANCYLYRSDKGYEPIRMNKSSLLAKFSKQDQKLIRKLLRRNEVKITDEASFVRAWQVIKENKLDLSCDFARGLVSRQ